MKKVVFYLLVLITFFLFVYNFVQNSNYNSIFFPYSTYNPMSVAVEFDYENTKRCHSDKIMIVANNESSSLRNSGHFFDARFSRRIDSLDVLVLEEYQNRLKNIIVTNELNLHYFTPDKLKGEKTKYCDWGRCGEYIKYNLDDYVRYNKNSSFVNYDSFLNTICAFIMNPLYDWQEYILPFIFLTVTFIYYAHYRKKPKRAGKKPYLVLISILLIGFLLRLNDLYTPFLWSDEVASVMYSHPDFPLYYTLNDPGNPPLFYILLRYFLKFFDISIVSTRTFALIFGMMSILSVWWFLYKKIDIKAANTGAFLCAININAVYFSGVARSYIVQAFLTPFIVYYLFRLIEFEKKKDFVIYSLLCAVALNLHYYEFFFVFSNFLWASILFIKNKKFKCLLYFIFANLISAISIIPYFEITAYKRAFLNSQFNSWIEPMAMGEETLEFIIKIFQGGISFTLSLIFLILNLFEKDDNKRTLVLYSMFSVTFVLFQSIIFSDFIRPLLIERYYFLLNPLLIIFISIIFSKSYKLKYLTIPLFILWFAGIQSSGSLYRFEKYANSLQFPFQYIKAKISLKEGGEQYLVLDLGHLIDDVSLIWEIKELKKYKLENVNYILSEKEDYNIVFDKISKNHKDAFIVAPFNEIEEQPPRKDTFSYRFSNIFLAVRY